MTKLHLALAIVASWILSSPVHAAFTLHWQSVPITVTTDALTPAPGLAGYQSYDLIVDADAGDDFQSWRMWSPPGHGFTFFNHALATTAPWAPPSAAQISAYPTLQYTMQQGNPLGAALIVLGSYNGTNEGPPPASLGPSLISVVAGDTAMITDGTPFRLLRMTFKGGSIPCFTGRVSVNVGGYTQNQSFEYWDCPEPGMLSMLACGLVMCRRLRVG